MKLGFNTKDNGNKLVCLEKKTGGNKWLKMKE
jgi:hypothetical protein